MTAARVTNRTDYAVRAVLYLSLQESERVVPIPEIAAETGLSVKFLEEILLLLRTAGIVQSRRGKQGGYSLLRPSRELRVADVVQALEGDAPPSNEGEGMERHPFKEVAKGVFHAAAEAWWLQLTRARMSDLAEEVRRLETERAGTVMFHI